MKTMEPAKTAAAFLMNVPFVLDTAPARPCRLIWGTS
jgi:hypothetical protein